MIYIAGKITGLPINEAIENFQKAENELHAINAKVINPLKLGIPATWSWEDQLKKCTEVIENRATAIFLLKDWSSSNGAKHEFKKVCKLNQIRRGNPIHIYFEDYHGLAEIEMDLREGVLNCSIPESSNC
jgi:hypothetical protein